MMIIELLVWSTLLCIFAGVILVLDYWGHLLREQDSYRRDELIDFYRILLRQFESLTARGDTALSYASIGAGIAVAWALTLFGGLLSPDITMAPDHAEDQIPNYFFQSILFLFILHIVWPSLKDVAMDQGGPHGMPARLVNTETTFFFGLAVALGAINLTMWGVYHHQSFLFCSINAGLCFVYAGYRLHTAERFAGDAYGDEYYPGQNDEQGEYDSYYDEDGADSTTAGPQVDDVDDVELGEYAEPGTDRRNDDDPY